MKTRLLLAIFFVFGAVKAQTTWPSQSWASATNLTSVMTSSGVVELSGLHWNPVNNRLYGVQDDGRLRVLQYDVSSSAFTLVASKTFDGGPEGITQVDFSANEFYTMDEDDYEIRKYTHNASFSTVTEARHWDLLQSPSPMTDTGNTGPEGVVFVPDSFLSAANFKSTETNQPYVSTKGMGGLMFVAHQNGGYVWVFDLNPNVNNDFAFVGKYRTSRSESCDLAFDRTTGLMYILHNVDSNYLEVTDLTLAPTPGAEPTFTVVHEYFIPNPAGSNVNVEGFAIMPKCGDITGSAFLCRDVASSEDLTVRQDVLRWFHPFVADGNCSLAADAPHASAIAVYPNPTEETLGVSGLTASEIDVTILDMSGKVISTQKCSPSAIKVGFLEQGEYVIRIEDNGTESEIKFVKK